MGKAEKNLQRWFRQHIADNGTPYTLDKHQASIVLDSHQNTIVTARAGSGKTRTIVAKITYLLAHEHIPPENIIVFAFNRKARAEINERLTKITYDGRPILDAAPEISSPTTPTPNPATSADTAPEIATTFHAFAYHILGGKNVIGNKLLTETEDTEIITKLVKAQLLSLKNQSASPYSNDLYSHISTNYSLPTLVATAKQFITRAEQKFFKNYQDLSDKISALKSSNKPLLEFLNSVTFSYHQALVSQDKLNFNQMMSLAAKQLSGRTTPYEYIFVDEYQDFSLLFLNLITALKTTCPSAHLLTVGDDWQAINRFAGSDVEYFTNFKKYFPDDCCKLFIPTNYRSGKKIVKNANFFMSTALGDYQGCKAGNKKSKAKLYLKDITTVDNSPYVSLSASASASAATSAALKNSETLAISAASDSVTTQKGNNTATATASHAQNIPLNLSNYFNIISKIVKDNPGKTIKLLHRNNDLSFRDWSLAKFHQELITRLLKSGTIAESDIDLISFSTIHRSKGLESDVVILLEIDAEKFPGKDKSGGLYEIFGDTKKTLFEDEARLFYVALTRPKEKLYILSKTTKFTKETKKLNFLSYLNQEWLEEL